MLQLGYDIAQQEEDSIALIKRKNAHPSAGSGGAHAGVSPTRGGGDRVGMGDRSRESGDRAPPPVGQSFSSSLSASSRSAQARILDHAKPPTAAQVMNANPFAISPRASSTPITPFGSAPIKRTMIGKNIPGHTPAISTSRENSVSSGKFARLPTNSGSGKSSGKA